MIGVFIDGERVGSLIHFPRLKIPCWVAYAINGRRYSTKTKKQAIAWLAEQFRDAK